MSRDEPNRLIHQKAPGHHGAFGALAGYPLDEHAAGEKKLPGEAQQHPEHAVDAGDVEDPVNPPGGMLLRLHGRDGRRELIRAEVMVGVARP